MTKIWKVLLFVLSHKIFKDINPFERNQNTNPPSPPPDRIEYPRLGENMLQMGFRCAILVILGSCVHCFVPLLVFISLTVKHSMLLTLLFIIIVVPPPPLSVCFSLATFRSWCLASSLQRSQKRPIFSLFLGPERDKVISLAHRRSNELWTRIDALF